MEKPISAKPMDSGYPRSPQIEAEMRDYVHVVGEIAESFQGQQVTEEDHKLAQLAGVWHRLEAYEELIARHDGDEDWVMGFLRHKYGDLIFQG